MIRVAAGQIGPIYESARKEETVERLIVLLEEAASIDVDLVNFPECALSTFFPRLVMPLEEAKSKYFEKSMPNPTVQPLFDRAKELKIGFNIGYAELDGDKHYNTMILVNKEGKIIGKYRKTHIPGSVDPPPKPQWPHLEKRYFMPGDTGFKVWNAFDGYVGMFICYDRRFPEAWRVLGLQGVELVLTGWNSMYHRRNEEFHNRLVLQAGSYQNATWCVGSAHSGEEEPGYINMGHSMIVSPEGEVVAMAATRTDELVAATIDLDMALELKGDRMNPEARRPEMYKIISEQKGIKYPE
ncbi:nitrilase-related carbon-nitrogen hydrolase [Bacteroidota bacterium]